MKVSAGAARARGEGGVGYASNRENQSISLLYISGMAQEIFFPRIYSVPVYSVPLNDKRQSFSAIFCFSMFVYSLSPSICRKGRNLKKKQYKKNKRSIVCKRLSIIKCVEL